MTAEAGLAALWLAAGFALLQFALSVIGVIGARDAVLRGVRPAAILQAVFVAIAFVCLIMCFLNSDMSVRLVAAESHSAKPWLYKFAGTWGNHEGSMLLWVAILGVAGAAVALFERTLEPRTHAATLASQAAIAFGFYAFLLFSSNPFARLDPAPADGQGLNPLLQDPGLAFHPPTLYIGYVGLSVAFSFAVGALLTQRVDAQFARAMRPWVLGAWIFLTLGITAGSYWAYYVLGWGGWWFWDPVENASLMPWLAATALLHSLNVLATRDGLRAWTVMLAVLAFSMSMVGTFLVRSGILTSVHAFAVDPQRGTFILALLAIYIGGALTLFALRAGSISEGARFDLVSREGALVFNNLLLTSILATVLVGTLYPLITEAYGVKTSIGAPFFNATAGPLALVLLVIMPLGPVMRWRRDDAKQALRRVALPALIGIVALITIFVLAPGIHLLPWFGLTVAFAVGAASVAPLWGRNLRRTPLFTYGMVLAHLGCAVSVAGMAADSAFLKEVLVAARVGETNTVGPYTVTFADVRPAIGANWTALEAELTAKRMDGWGRFWNSSPLELHPQARMYPVPVTETSETAIATPIDGQLYLVLGKQQDDGRWQLRMWWKPFVTLIWAGGAMIALGGALALLGRLWRARRQATRKMEGGV